MTTRISPDTTYDVIVLGGGSAGTAASSAAVAAGARTALVNDGELGGLCILRGCMPTKTLLHSAHVLHEMKTSAPLGVRAASTSFDFPAIMRRKDEKVARFKRAKVRGIEASAYDVIDGRASFVDAETVSVGGKAYRAKGYVIATGSVPDTPAIPGIDGISVMTSDDVMKLDRLPASVVVQGVGPIGLELGQFMARLGVEVLLVNRSRPLSKIDAECSEEMVRVLGDEPSLELRAPCRITAVAKDGDAILFTLDAGEGETRHRAEAFLSATGRRPAIDGLGLEAAGIEADLQMVRHDETMRTTNPRVYVAGDATGWHQILHLANQEGTVAGHNAAVGSGLRKMDYRLRMSVIFTDPPFATVGLSQGELKCAGVDAVCAVKRFPEQGRAITMEVEHGLLKVVAHPMTGEILGAQILGPRADDIIHVLAAAMYFRGTVQDLARMPWYHPTLSEALIEVARDLSARITGERPGAPPPA